MSETDLSPEPPLAFPGATGKGVRVAVIDSGVHASHPHIIAPIVGGVSLFMNGSAEEGVFVDRLGHGTAVTAAIQEKAPGAEYYAVKVFDESLRTTADCLIRAVDWCISHQIHVVNLSLGTTNMAHLPAFESAGSRAAAAGIVLVAAADVDGQPCLPGCLPDIYGVGLDWDCPRSAFRVDQTGTRIRFRASGYPRSAPGVAPRRNLHGISFAVANMTGIFARAMENSGVKNLTESLLAVLDGSG